MAANVGRKATSEPTLVTSYEEVVANVEAFAASVGRDIGMAQKLSRFRHWYYIPGLATFGPSKFVGYRGMDGHRYLSPAATDGRDTEAVLKDFFEPVTARSAVGRKLSAELTTMLAAHGKTPNTRATIHVPQRRFIHASKVQLDASMLSDPSWVRDNVHAFFDKGRFGASEAEMVAFGAKARLALQQKDKDVLESFAWRVRRWGSLRGARAQAPCIVEALLARRTELDRFTSIPLGGRAEEAAHLLQAVVASAAARMPKPVRHWSWISKVLHFMWPGHFAIYDSYVSQVIAPDPKLLEYQAIMTAEARAIDSWALADVQHDGRPAEALRAVDMAIWNYVVEARNRAI